MDNLDRIKIGDKVKVYFNKQTAIAGVVEYIPVATGDCWLLSAQGFEEGLVYIQQFDFMMRVNSDEQ